MTDSSGQHGFTARIQFYARRKFLGISRTTEAT